MKLSEQKVIRVLVVEDSRVVAEFLTHVLNADPGIRVVGIAANGEEGLKAAQQTKPDVITMDIHMPKVNGFETTRRIMETCPTPIVIVSGSVSVAAVTTTFQAIEAGALAVVARPPGPGHPHHEVQVKELVATVKLMSEVKVVRRWPRSRFMPAIPAVPQVETQKLPGTIQAVAIGASTGGPLALRTLLSGLPPDFAAPVLIVQHMASGFVAGFVEWLAHSSGFPARVATAGERLLPGHAYVAPDDFHLGVSTDHRILLSKDVQENGLRPAVAFLFRSVAAVFGPNAVGVLLTGMGEDGVEELKRLTGCGKTPRSPFDELRVNGAGIEITGDFPFVLSLSKHEHHFFSSLLKDAGALTIAQDEESSVIHGMPGQAIQVGAALQVLPPEAIAKTLTIVVTKP